MTGSSTIQSKKMRNFITLLLFTLLIVPISCDQNNRTPKVKEVKVVKLENAKTYVGKINGKFKFTLNIMRDGNVLKGYAINTYQDKNTIKGTIDQNDAFIIHEYYKGKEKGVFEGRMLAGGGIRGTWSNPEGALWFPFEMKERTN